MKTHSFTLIVEGVDIHDPDVFDALYEAGCDDALIGTTVGIPVMDFSRKAASLYEAISSAVADAESVDGLPGRSDRGPRSRVDVRNRGSHRALARVRPAVGERKARAGRISGASQQSSRPIPVSGAGPTWRAG